ncbi:hypothetical protein ABCR94_37720 [Streptomyces sp. 21So2-11]|uniref:hypothetical protein n=1 Tax=Streptomyces sp. 21So2-11 TaxID=3144408 RepID=UPI00321952F0
MNLIHPHGTAGSRTVISNLLVSARRLLRFMHDRGFDGCAGDLSRLDLIEFWMGGRYNAEMHTRRMLAAWDEDGARLSEPVRLLIQGRMFNQRERQQPLVPYSESEWDRLIGICRRNVREALAAHAAAVAAASRGHDPLGSGRWSFEDMCRLLAERGPLAARHLKALGVQDKIVRAVRRPLANARAALFPQPDTVISYQLLFGAYSGIVPDGIDGLSLDDIEWAGDSQIVLGYIKGRTTRESLNLPRKAVRLLERWLEHSALLRSHAPRREDRGVLWLRDRPNFTGNVETTRITEISVRAWIRRHGLMGDSGAPLLMNRQRIRTTFHSFRDRRTWSGSPRATIDPNHTPAVEADHYLTATTPAQQRAVEAIIEDAQGDLLRRAMPPTVLPEEAAVVLAREYPQVIDRLGLDGTALEELVGGQRDVFVAACSDQLAGLHGPKGKPCPARPWVCLLCPLAVFTPRHAVNLLRLKAFFARQWRQMPNEHFMAVFGPYAQRITEVLDRFDPALLEASSREVADTDDELPLRPEERTA